MISTLRLAFGCACRRRARRARSGRGDAGAGAAQRGGHAQTRAERHAAHLRRGLVATVGSASHAHVASCQQYRASGQHQTLLRPIARAGWRRSRQHHDESDRRAIESQAAGRCSWTMPTPAGPAARLGEAAGVKVANRLFHLESPWTLRTNPVVTRRSVTSHRPCQSSCESFLPELPCGPPRGRTGQV